MSDFGAVITLLTEAAVILKTNVDAFVLSVPASQRISQAMPVSVVSLGLCLLCHRAPLPEPVATLPTVVCAAH